VGPAIALAVKAGDRVQLSAWARFKSSEAAFSKTPISGIIASALAGQYAYSNGLESAVQAANTFNAGLLGLANPLEDADDGRPYAYLNYIVFNSSYAKVDGGAKRVPQGAGFTEAQRYIYVWVSNESENTEVWFDDINVIHQKTLIAQATDYEAWGGVLREQKWEDMEGKYRWAYQGKYSEFDTETSFNHYQLREYDPQIGRWTSPDPKKQFHSSYIGMGNNPISGVDPDGGWLLSGLFKSAQRLADNINSFFKSKYEIEDAVSVQKVDYEVKYYKNIWDRILGKESTKIETAYQIIANGDWDVSCLSTEKQELVNSFRNVLDAPTAIFADIVNPQMKHPNYRVSIGAMKGGTVSSHQVLIPSNLPDFTAGASKMTVASQTLHELLWHVSPLGASYMREGKTAGNLYNLMGVSTYTENGNKLHPGSNFLNRKIQTSRP
jgi:RHS repeat-associated protein